MLAAVDRGAELIGEKPQRSVIGNRDVYPQLTPPTRGARSWDLGWPLM
jgi:hypothetical protein